MLAQYRVAQGTDESHITAQYLISYGLDEQRIRTQYYSNGSLQKTRYYLGSYEEEISPDGTITKIDYIYTPVGLTAMQRGNTLYYVHTDRQGSLERITDTSGTIVTAYAYTPWGGRILLSGVDITDRGYTGHEHLVALNLINMNGRVYDPVLARFLSPDPYVQAPDFTQSFNRYAYCLNNPFKYVDPEGELFYIIPSISWSPSGGLSVLVNAGFGIYGVANVGGAIGYNFKNDSWSFTANASLGGFYVYGGYDTKAGWMAGAGYGFGGGGGAFSFNTNLTSMGVSWSQNGGWSANAFGFNASQNGIQFDPSVGASYKFESYVSEQKSGVLSKMSYKDALKLAKIYNSLSSTDISDDILSEKIKSEFNGFEEGEEVHLITTRVKNGYGVDNEGNFVNSHGEIINGIFSHALIGTKSLYISTKTLNSDIVTFRAVAEHEIIHAVHYNTTAKYKLRYESKYTEKVAYEYTAQTYLNAGRYVEAMANQAMAYSYYNGNAIPFGYSLSFNKYIRY